jgi:DNA-binding CsgD family transcriptional regulator
MDVFLEQYSILVQLTYDAATDPAAWPTFLAALSKSFESATGLLHHYDATLGITPTFKDFGHDARFISAYAEHYAGINPYPAESFAKLAPGKVNHARMLVDPQAVAATEFFNDWMKPQGISPDHIGVVLTRSSEAMALLCVAPQACVFDKNPQFFADRLQLLVPHLQKALEMNRALGAAQLAAELSNAMIDAIPAAVFLLYDTGKLLFANREGEALLQSGPVVAVDSVTRTFRMRWQKERVRFERAMDTAKSSHQPQIFRVVSPGSGSAYVMTVFPLASRRPKGFESLGNAGLAVLVTSSSSHVELQVDAIRAATGLTPAEARLAKALVSGASLAEYAQAAGISINTARRQLASAFFKTETNKQGELVALLTRSLGIVTTAVTARSL